MAVNTNASMNPYMHMGMAGPQVSNGYGMADIINRNNVAPPPPPPEPPPPVIPQRQLKYSGMPQAGWTPPQGGFSSILNPTQGAGQPAIPTAPVPPRPMPSPARPQQSFMPQANAQMNALVAQRKAGGM
jgi:hypothetical protein